MAITLAGLRQLSVREHPVSYDERDTMLYALSLGMGEDAADPAAECFISELQGLRALLMVLMTALNFWALQYLQLAETGAIQFSVPLLIALLSAWWLGERLDARRWAAILAGFAGVLLVITYAAYSVLSVTHQAWGAMLAGDESQRAQIVARLKQEYDAACNLPRFFATE